MARNVEAPHPCAHRTCFGDYSLCQEPQRSKRGFGKERRFYGQDGNTHRTYRAANIKSGTGIGNSQGDSFRHKERCFVYQGKDGSAEIASYSFSLGLFFAPLGLPPFLPFSALVGLGRLPIICEWIERTSASVRIFPQCGHLAGIGISRFT